MLGDVGGGLRRGGWRRWCLGVAGVVQVLPKREPADLAVEMLIDLGVDEMAPAVWGPLDRTMAWCRWREGAAELAAHR